jgi:hypothetical protein
MSDEKSETVECHWGSVEVTVSGWGAWNIWLRTEPEPFLPEVLLQPRDALRLAWRLVVNAGRLWCLQRKDRCATRRTPQVVVGGEDTHG